MSDHDVKHGKWSDHCGAEYPDDNGVWMCTREPEHEGSHEATNGCQCGNCTPEVQFSWPTDDEQFCPDCFAGMESSEHQEKCVWPAERAEDDLYLARAQRAFQLMPELLRLESTSGRNAAVVRLANALHEAAEEA